LRLTCAGDPQPELLKVIHEHRPSLIAFIEAENRLWAAHQASLEAGRITLFPKNLLDLVHPSIRATVSSEAAGAWDSY
jgi:hypothetical protein